MSSAMLPDTQDLAVALEQASELAEGTDFEIQDYTASDVEGVGVYSYTCLLNKSDAADVLLCVDLGGRRIIKKKKTT